MPRTISLSLELLQTFVLLLRNDGDAAVTAEQLDINQPSMSKRLKFLQHAGPLLQRPWLVREGRTWSLTAEGQRVLPAVEDILARYEQLTASIAEPLLPRVRFACGQQAVGGFVRQAMLRFRKQYPDVALQVSTTRGAQRIEGVANGLLDLATVTHDEPHIMEIARRQLHTEALREDRLVLACAQSAPWARDIEKSPKTKVSAAALTKFPLIVPEPDSGTRLWLDDILRGEGVLHELNLVLETGGWSTILKYVQDAFGVGVVSERAAQSVPKLITRRLDPSMFPPRVTRLICRRQGGGGEKLDLTAEATAFRKELLRAVKESG